MMRGFRTRGGLPQAPGRSRTIMPPASAPSLVDRPATSSSWCRVRPPAASSPAPTLSRAAPIPRVSFSGARSRKRSISVEVVSAELRQEACELHEALRPRTMAGGDVDMARIAGIDELASPRLREIRSPLHLAIGIVPARDEHRGGGERGERHRREVMLDTRQEVWPLPVGWPDEEGTRHLAAEPARGMRDGENPERMGDKNGGAPRRFDGRLDR